MKTIARTILIVAALALALPQPSRAQMSAGNEPRRPSADAWEFMKYGEIHPSLYTGTLSLSIPFYTYKDPDFELPISFDYATTGHIPNVVSGILGPDWTLNLGGVITREVRGLPDDKSHNIDTGGGTIYTEGYLSIHKSAMDISQATLYTANDGRIGDELCYWLFPSGGADGRWRFSGKEWQAEPAGLPLLDFGARMYDPATASWLSQDPMAEKYPFLSPYSYCAGDPVNLVDPYGMDIWELNSFGKVINIRLDTSEDRIDMMKQDSDGEYFRDYTIDDTGELKYKSISFNYGTFTNKQTKDYSEFTSRDFNSSISLFRFLSVNTSVEFGLIETKDDGGIVRTNYSLNSVDITQEAMKQDKLGSTIMSIIHSHPKNSIPSGFSDGKVVGDKLAAQKLQKSKGYIINHYVYRPKDDYLVGYTGQGIIPGIMCWEWIYPDYVK